MKRITIIAGGAAVIAASLGIASMMEEKPLRVVPSIDLERYAGTWYEIARLPNRFQEQCAGEVTANYTLESNGTLTVVNRCRLENGNYTEAKGVARLAGKGQPNSVLKVRFAPAFLSFLPWVWGDYQILSLAPDYAHALIGSPNRKYLWILSRSAQLDDATYARLVEDAKAQDFDVTTLQRTRQDGN
jgi:apolipoprotein D and lipocalin family protein